ncbi:zinc ABC transporter substrate-binding protein AztC [Streptomyces griseoviridis]|jgi:zinc/manganese transport system substrate-binding protein|uniref:Zinc/manganese transport system substrate-binding protein n=3 Tax=Streptomyces TaxID=1883 RepID=A0ABT9L8R9_STRGD|nr:MULTISPECIES: zinc ABC transporter substrate-binding protein AztC [Streptomyces]MDP9680095.1 zinc/manganese transport system substrate-binding protein [Streptomyces griseoviridis]GGS47165.1 ABC transporter substrate-binding protein [Streptomyces niveoruber]GGT05433.1 ABC transporter substrate-binding protein [Streptomyces griseoviridis]GGU66195.1 ABC transporter substrate-binding protein [Streptomyces daghestanicus]GHI29391.1 ABC transporter substrate-binding protein [Streptomyces daghestan
MSRHPVKRRARAGATRLRGLVAGLLTLVTAVTASACATGEERPRVVVTTNILGDITREIVGAEAEVTVLMKPDADPHSFGLSAVQAAELERADLVICNGLGLEENVLRHVDAARASGVATLAVGDAVDPLTFHASDDGGPADAAGQADPHFWTDPDRVRKATGLIADQVIEHVHGVDGTAIRANADRYDAELADLTAWMEKSFDRIPEDDRALVTNHHVFGYLADRFGFRVIGAVVPSGTTLASPSSADLKSLTEAMEDAGVRTVFADSSQPTRLAEVLRTELDDRVRVVRLYSESLTAKGGGADTYLRMMRANTTAMTDGLTGA